MQAAVVVAVLEGVISVDLRQRRLDRHQRERTFAAVVPIGTLRTDRPIVLEIESRKDVVLPVRRNSRKAEVARPSAGRPDTAAA